MLLSYKNKFVFIKNKKVAGTSVEMALSSICGDDDIISLISPKDEIERLSMYNVHCKNFAVNRRYENSYIRKLKFFLNDCIALEKEKYFSVIFNQYSQFYHVVKYSSHMDISDVVKASKININDYLLIYICRNPYKQIISRAEYKIMSSHGYSRSFTIREYSDRDIKNCLNKFFYVFINGVKNNITRVACESASKITILRYESLQKDFDALLDMLGYPRIALPHAKKSQRDKTTDMNFFSNNQIAYINEELHEYFERYNYPKIDVVADGLSDRAAALAGREVYFFGCGAAYEANKHLFAASRPRAILVDMVPESGLPESVDGLPVRFARDVLPDAAAKGEILPLVVFARKDWALRVAANLEKAYPAFAGDNMILCGL
jgi:hypothetical protein